MRYPLAAILILALASMSQARGLLIPVEPDLPPLAMLNHHVHVTIEDQVAVTKVQQTFRNHTDTELEATFVFPVPAGASVREFTMWVDGKRCKGELLKADKAKKMYTDIVRQTKNPALLDYLGSDMLRMRVYPIPPKGDQKVELSFTAVAKKEHAVVEYTYPLKTDRTAASTMEEFQLEVKLMSQQPISNIYSPTHDVAVSRVDDHQAVIRFEAHAATLDRDFQLFYTHTGQDIGLTTLQHRPIAEEDGYAMLLVSPRAELSDSQKVPRDIVFVVDTSGSMNNDNKMQQAKTALRHCLAKLAADDRFAVISFATTVDRYRDKLVTASSDQIAHAKGWVADLYAGGGTAIDGALSAALEMRTDEEGRMFTVVFLTDGRPTIGETDTDKILANLESNNSSQTRIFTLGLGDNLHATFLDQIAARSRALSSYVGTNQNIETRVASFFDKIHHPVLANLELTTDGDTRLVEMYPPQLPDLFHGDQLVLLARYQGDKPTRIILDGMVGIHRKQFVYDVDFAARSVSKPFVEELWARRKVGYLLDQIRINGEETELVDEVVRLAKAYGITTPYTSYLVMPDAPVLIASASEGDVAATRYYHVTPPALSAGSSATAGGKPQKVVDFARHAQPELGELATNRGAFQDQTFENLQPQSASAATPALGLVLRRQNEAKWLKSTLDQAQANYRGGRLVANQVDKLGVDLAVCTNNLKCQNQLVAKAVRNVASRNCMEFGGVWVDESFTAKTKTVAVKAQSDAYFKILAAQPQMKEVFQLGNFVVWIAPNGTGLVIDENDGLEKMSDREITMLFAKG